MHLTGKLLGLDALLLSTPLEMVDDKSRGNGTDRLRADVVEQLGDLVAIHHCYRLNSLIKLSAAWPWRSMKDHT